MKHECGARVILVRVMTRGQTLDVVSIRVGIIS